MSDEIKKTVDEVVADIFSDSKSTNEQIVELPSKGVGYAGGVSKVTIRTMTFEDEKAISESTPDQDIVNLMLTRCTDGVDIDTLYSADKIFLLFKLRELSYGSSIKVSRNCDSCKKENSLDIDMSQLEVIYAGEDFKDPKEVLLPNLNKVVSIRLPRSSDVAYLATKTKILTNLWRFVVKLDKYTDPKVLSAVIKKMSSKDTRVLLENLLVDDFGLQNRAKFICSECGSENIVEVPITEAFFTVS